MNFLAFSLSKKFFSPKAALEGWIETIGGEGGDRLGLPWDFGLRDF